MMGARAWEPATHVGKLGVLGFWLWPATGMGLSVNSLWLCSPNKN